MHLKFCESYINVLTNYCQNLVAIILASTAQSFLITLTEHTVLPPVLRCYYRNSHLTFFVSCVSIMKLWTCFSALVNSNFLEATVTNNAVHPAPC